MSFSKHVLMDEEKGDGASAGGEAGDGAAAAASSAAVGAAGKQASAAGSAAAAQGGPAGDGKAAADKGADKADAKGVWPEDWQKRFAGEDEKELKQVARYASPEEVWKKARALERRMSSGELRPVLPKNPTADDLKAWRKDHGIPEKPDAYDLRGITIDEDDKPVVDQILAVAHKNNYTPEQARAAVTTFYEIANGRETAMLERDETQRSAAMDALAQEWGGSFTRNKNLIGNVLSRFPESVREDLMSARFPDGTALFNHPDVLRTFVSLELERNPTGIVAPAGDGDLGKSMTERYLEIQKVMRQERTKYDKDPAMQKEFRTLADAMLKNGLIDKNGNVKQAA